MSGGMIRISADGSLSSFDTVFSVILSDQLILLTKMTHLYINNNANLLFWYISTMKRSRVIYVVDIPLLFFFFVCRRPLFQLFIEVSASLRNVYVDSVARLFLESTQSADVYLLHPQRIAWP